MDIITSFCFAESLNALDHKGFRHPVLVGVEVALPMYWVFKHFRPVQWIFMHTPTWLSLLMSPETAGIMGVQNVTSLVLTSTRLLLDLENKKAGESLPTRHGLFDEAMALLIAGSDTVGNTLAVGGFHVLNNPNVYEKLFNELKKNWLVLEKSLGYEELEKMPYLNAVIKESLRVSHGVVSALPRVVPPSGATIGGAYIPGGTVVGMSSPYVHMNEGIFPEAHRFIPERWLQPNSKHLEHWLVPFSRGPRMCLGVNLAWCELTIGFAHIFRKFDLKLHETTERDIMWKEYFVPHFKGKRVQSFIKLRPS
ncbi:uncharacterized protein H6S33_002702 [Morchella sextelata]|uniref:uncharacterized protein n=1 Tax=Morchella sextelata TaxID=1174677 RepID=UPI001D058409|nr:uncharacterized protein H6S33_002702 [Morchella sextelata]KAH0607668.1 hypothetical protein H6S33_002702 [Morchella sextelata]